MKKKRSNPFYTLLVIASVAFTISACAYGVMMYRVSTMIDEPTAGEPGLMPWLQAWGTPLLAIELGVLVVASLAAMATDGHFSRSESAREEELGESASNRPIDRSEK
jgi:hypothetical protein